MRPQADYFYCFNIVQYLVDQPVLDIDSPGVGARQVSKSASSPTGILGALLNGGFEAFSNRLPHPRHGHEIQSFLNRPPVFFGNENCGIPLSYDLDRQV
jgi:hypothetical protein